MVWPVDGSTADKCHSPKKNNSFQMKICVVVTAMVMFGRVEIHINLIALC